MRVVPIRLDSTQLPPLLSQLYWLRVEEPADVEPAVRRLMGIGSHSEFIKAIQQTIEESGIEYRNFEGYGPAVGCPKCGSPSEDLRQTVYTDYERERHYAGVKCPACGWEDGGEV